jgi:trk system potassium uptake protein TrkA
MHIIVVGCGKVGAKFSDVMSHDGHDIVVIDNDTKNFDSLDHNFSGLTVLGVPIDEDVLKMAGIETADCLVAVTPDDNINMMACQVAKEIFKVPLVFARIQDPVREEVFFQFGVQTICPTNMAVEELKSLINGEQGLANRPMGNAVVTFSYGEVTKDTLGMHIDSVKVPPDSMMFGVLRDNQLIFSSSELIFGKDDIIVIASIVK